MTHISTSAVESNGASGEYCTPTLPRENTSAAEAADKSIMPTVEMSEAILNAVAEGTDLQSWRMTDTTDEPPTEGLNDSVKSFIASLCEARRVPKEFVMAPMIAAVSAAAGSLVKIFGGGYTNQLNVFVSVIAPSSSNKSRPAKDIMSPLETINRDLFARSKRERESYEAAKEAKAKSKTAPELPPLPKKHQLIVSNITDESRLMLLADNPHGILQYNDELDTFVNNIGKYAKSNELGELITIHDGGDIVVNRIGRSDTMLEKPYFSLFGTIQPSIAVKRLATEDGYLSGFTPRILLFQPPHVEYHNKVSTDVSGVLCKWSAWIETIYRNETERVLTISEAADKVNDTFMSEAADIQESTENDSERAVVGKLKISVWKLAAIAHVLNEAAQGATTPTVTDQEMSWACDLCKYIYRRHIALLEQTDLCQQRPSKKQAIETTLKAMPDISLAKLAELFGVNPNTVRSIKHRLGKNGVQR